MRLESDALREAYTLSELAKAAGVPTAEVRSWAELGAIRTLLAGDGRTWVSDEEACRVGPALRDGTLALLAPCLVDPRGLFSTRPTGPRSTTPFAVSTGLHAGLLAGAVVMAALGTGHAAASAEQSLPAPSELRLVYLAIPGAGGGGGGGGLRSPVPAPAAERRGDRRLASSLPDRMAPLPVPLEIPPEPTPIEPERLPAVEAPLVPSAADEQERVGVLEASDVSVQSQGPGTDGGVGQGTGAGIGEGDGSGVGDGRGGGTGGGPYRPGSGVSPPALLEEVRPDYSDQARRSGVAGDVLMEIVVLGDGTVGEVRLLRGLGFGLDERAVAAVRQWRFSPARRAGVPVDVVVEVAMEFTLR